MELMGLLFKARVVPAETLTSSWQFFCALLSL